MKKRSFISKAFRVGFVSGLGAPGMLFPDFLAPTVRRAKVQVHPIRREDGYAIAGDWIRVGGDIRSAVKQYGEISKAA